MKTVKGNKKMEDFFDLVNDNCTKEQIAILFIISCRIIYFLFRYILLQNQQIIKEINILKDKVKQFKLKKRNSTKIYKKTKKIKKTEELKLLKLGIFLEM